MPSKTTSAKKKKTVKKKELSDAARLRRNRMWSSVIFILGVFVIFLTYINGEFLWNGVHNTLWGLFGLATVLVAPIMLYVAVMLALDRSKSAVLTKVIQGGVLLLLICPVCEIIYCFGHKLPVFELVGGEDKNVFSKIGGLLRLLFERGVDKQGGGALSIIIGGTLSKLCGAVGAMIIIILLVILFAMLLTNITFVDVWNFFAGLLGNARDAIRESGEERDAIEAQRIAEKKAEEKEKEKANKDKRIDVAKFITDDLPAQPENTENEEKKDKKKKKSIFDRFDEPTVYGEPTEELKKDIPEPEKQDKPEDKPAEKPAEPAVPDIREGSNVINTAAAEMINPLYVNEDGQTTFIKTEETVRSAYNIPPIDLLNAPSHSASVDDIRAEIQQNSETLVETLRSFGVTTRLIDTHRGPSVTRYELQPAAGVKVSKITNLSDDIALNLAAEGVRIEAPIPGKAAVGIELANKVRDTVYIRELIDSDEFRGLKSKLGFPVGKNIEGKIVCGDIAKMPHLLIAGTTGSGKSVFTNSIIMSILYNASPEEVKLILVDPKQVEFPVYNGIPHLLIPVVTDAKKAAGALGWAVTEMMKRYKIFSDNGVRDLGDYNEYVKDKEGMEPLPKIVIVVDELADLMMAAPKEVEESICRIAQLARAAGMHLVIATQSPRADIVTGLIKANIPSRVALKVSNQIDSRVILDEGGAEKLLGNGDLLYKPVGLGKPVRIQGSYTATEEIRRVVEFLKSQTASEYDEEIAEEIEKHIPVPKGDKQNQAAADSDPAADNGQGDLIERAIECIVRENVASTTFLQRRLKLGYARAARIMDELMEMGIVGPADGAKPREIKMSKEQWLERKTAMGETPILPMQDPEDEE